MESLEWLHSFCSVKLGVPDGTAQYTDEVKGLLKGRCSDQRFALTHMGEGFAFEPSIQ